jgi:cysteinyl-tRNA synthetase
MRNNIHLHLYNSLSHKVELFVPLDPNNVRFYACGPTVYDRPHIGNARAAVVYDMLFRVLRFIYSNVVYVCNITDVDDKIIQGARNSGQSIKELTTTMERFYHEDLKALNCLRPTHEPRATEHITDMIQMIEKLIASGHAYYAEGHVLFHIPSFPEYGKLSRRDQSSILSGARIEVAPYKKDPADFVLWKPIGHDEEGSGFPSPWGLGRPGWHIECSAMSKHYLGAEFDLHGGGADLMFPHHENEIAQNCCADQGTTFAKYWMHNGFLTVDGEKMSKSLGNFYTVHDILAHGINGSVIRYLYMTTHYRKPLDFNEMALNNAKKSVHKLYFVWEKYQAGYNEYMSHHGQEIHLLLSDLISETLAQDMNTALFIAQLLHLAHEAQHEEKIESAALMIAACEFIGLQLYSSNAGAERNVSQAQYYNEAMSLLALRSEAKAQKDWHTADKIRSQIEDLGFNIVDKGDNTSELL